jgi:hypothetical protein
MDRREMSELARDRVAVRRIAKSLLKHFENQFDDNAIDFLTRLATEKVERWEYLSGRESSFLLALINRGNNRKQLFGGYRAYTLLSELWAIHLDLNEDEEEFVSEMMELGPDVALTDRQWRYVLHLCRANDIIHHWVAA